MMTQNMTEMTSHYGWLLVNNDWPFWGHHDQLMSQWNDFKLSWLHDTWGTEQSKTNSCLQRTIQNVQSVFQLWKWSDFVICCEKLVREMSNSRLDFPSKFPQQGRQQQFASTSLWNFTSNQNTLICTDRGR